VGAAPDSAAFGDSGTPDTLRHVWEAVGGFQAPTLARLGFLAAAGIQAPPDDLMADYGRLQPLSLGGKDSVTGHWEMMGVTLTDRFPTYPNGFPETLITALTEAIGRGVLANRPASGTQVIEEFGAEHIATGKPIVYTSADSVFQIAAHEDVIAVETLYSMCEIVRELCHGKDAVQRVIARPFTGSPGQFTRTQRRRDYPLPAPLNLAATIGDVYGIGVVPELFGGIGFRNVVRTQSNREHAAELARAMQSDARFIFANFEDFDMKHGHRSDPVGFARCLEDFDAMVAAFLPTLEADDLLLITADHGNDPTDASTDHTREYVPYIRYNLKNHFPKAFGDLPGLAVLSDDTSGYLGLPGKTMPSNFS
jgi:phosphopentomutase